MKRSFFPFLSSTLVLQAAIQHSPAIHLYNNAVSLFISKSIIHKATTLLHYIFILLGHKMILWHHKIILLGHKVILWHHKTILLSHKIILLSHKVILLSHKIVLLGHIFLQREIIPIIIRQNPLLFKQNIFLPQNNMVWILHNPFSMNVNNPQ